MSATFPVVTICGSMRYYEQMKEAAETLTAKGCVVLMPFVSKYAGGVEPDALKEMLDLMHKQKIDMSDAIVVIGAHRGDSTIRETNYAYLTGKPVFRAIDNDERKPA